MSEFEAHEIERDRKALEALVVDNPDLERLKALMGRFNMFKAIGVVRQELRYSDLLARASVRDWTCPGATDNRRFRITEQLDDPF